MGRDFEVEIARAESKLAALRTKARDAARRDDTRRKIIAGGALLAAVDLGAIPAAQVRALLDRMVARSRDRQLFAAGDLAIPPTRNDAPPAGTAPVGPRPEGG